MVAIKTCKKCLLAKDLKEFYSQPNTSDLKASSCKLCVKQYAKNRRLTVPEVLSENNKRYRNKHKEKIKEIKRVYAKKNSAEIVTKVSLWRLNNPGARAKEFAKYKQKRKPVDAAYSEKNRERKRVIDRAYKKANPDLVLAQNRERELLKVKRTPPWLNDLQKKQIRYLYKKARALYLETGVKMHVDHIVPINGAIVSGLHVPWNLRIITAKENLQKGARF